MTLAFSRNVATERQNGGKWELAVRKDLRVVLQKQILCGNELKEKPSWSFSSWFTKPRHRRATALIGWSSQNRLLLTQGRFRTPSVQAKAAKTEPATWGVESSRYREMPHLSRSDVYCTLHRAVEPFIMLLKLDPA